MKHIFQVENVKCGGCAGTLKSKLEPEFGVVEVNLDVMPREITVDINDNQLDTLRVALKKLGYPMSDENLGFVENTTAKAKSFVSCAIGKMDS